MTESSLDPYDDSMRLTRQRALRHAAALGVSAAGAGAFLAAADTVQASPSAAAVESIVGAKSGGTLKVALAANFEDFDPQRSPFGNYPFIQQLYNPILSDENQPDASKPLPWLGRLKYARDSRYVDITVQPGIKFHDGKPLNAAAVIANLEKARHEVKGADTKAAWDPIIGKLTKIDNLTARLTYKQPTPSAYVTQLFALLGIVSPALIAGNYKALKTKANGTGAFRLASYRQGDKAILKKNPTYFKKGLPYLDGIEFQFFSDPDAQVAALESGGAHMAVDVPPAYLERLRSRFQVKQGAPAICYEVLMSADTGKPFAPKLARQAMQHLVNRQRFCKDIMFGTCTPAYVHVDPKSLGYNPAYATRYPYDPEKAKAMFQQLGMLGKAPIKFMQLQGVLPGWGRLAEMVAGDMQAIGLNVQLDPQDFSVFGENVWGSNKGNYQMLTSFMGRGNRYPTFLSQGNIQLNAVANPAFPGSKPPAKYNEGFLKLSVALTEKAQRKWALQMTEAIMDESWDIAVAYQRTQYAMVKNLQGFVVSRDEHPILERMSFT